MRAISRRTIFRCYSLTGVLLCMIAWGWSRHRPTGLVYIHDDIWLCDSSDGLITITRDDGDLATLTGWPKGWHAYVDSCFESDFATTSKIWLRPRSLGFGFGVERPTPTPSLHKTLILDANGTPISVDLSVLVFHHPSRPKHRQVVLIVPWWSILVVALAITLFAWHKTKPRHAAFLIFPVAHNAEETPKHP